MYRLDVLVQGFPGKAVCHGGLGWSTIALLRSQERKILIDVGAFGIRKPLAKLLAAHDVRADQITDVVLTHAHYDHAVNFVLFPNATVWIGRDELAWAAAQPPGFDPLPELYVDALDADPRVRRVADGDEFLPGLRAHAAPGHTPGSMIFHLTTNPVPVIFTGDAAKNRAELISRRVDASEDDAASRASIEMIWRLWRQTSGTIVIPGHDLSMRLGDDGAPVYTAKRCAGISAWFAETLEDTTVFDFAGAAS
ncbi:MAG: MBL fold metallo-hydrolase [Rhodoplanes sp.]|uniref:MBL fold metallo-hydrolase n=1 Tax=Rhodoplanes sp. TaxID=1968906 RepID=UPI0017AB1A57|nr:MBL fold metallo-hydrolase [Rhodoplanes sp.]NVO12558.1 MBL fold metallo-hydrolase [Rhodoplanes sp.]